MWLATALLHEEHPDRADFTVSEIVERAGQERLTPSCGPAFTFTPTSHCVANRPPNPGRYLMLVETGREPAPPVRPGDPAHEARRGAKTTPLARINPAQVPALLDWYAREYAPRRVSETRGGSLLALRGSGAKLWADEPADQYVRRLREGWR